MLLKILIRPKICRRFVIPLKSIALIKAADLIIEGILVNRRLYGAY